MRAILRAGDARGRERACNAVRRASGTDASPQVHQTLRIGRHCVRIAATGGARRQQRFCQLPEARNRRRSRGVAFNGKVATKHPAHVAVQDRRPNAGAKGSDRAGRAAPDAGKRLELLCAGGELPVPVAHHRPGARVQVARARVVAQPSPVGHHFPDGRVRERGDIGEPGEEFFVIGDHGRHLRLLKHDLRKPDPVRVASLLPGKLMPAVRALPGNDAGCELHDVHYACGGRLARTRSLRLKRMAWRRAQSPSASVIAGLAGRFTRAAAAGLTG